MELIQIPRPIRLAVEDELRAHYASGDRHYHTFAHAMAVYAHCSWAHQEVGLHQPTEVALAALFHDAVFDTQAAKYENERASAELAMELLKPFDKKGVVAHDVYEMVYATAFHGERHNFVIHDNDMLLDADMVCAVGIEWGAFEYATAQIRREYAHVSDEDWRRGRAKFLAKLYAGDSIFLTDLFRDQFEAIAQSNVERALKELLR